MAESLGGAAIGAVTAVLEGNRFLTSSDTRLVGIHRAASGTAAGLVHQQRAESMHQPRRRPRVIGQFLAFVTEGLDLGLRWRIRDGQPADLPVGVGVPQPHRLLARPGGLWPLL